MKKMRNIGLLAALAITAGLSVLACNWYSAEPDPAIAPSLFAINAQGIVTGLSTQGFAAVAAGETDIVIPPVINGIEVTAIGVFAFENSQLTSVVIPAGVTTIGNNAFQNNNLLTSVVIPAGVTTIGSSAFQNNNLTEVIIPSSVQTIGTNAFQNNNLTEVTIPSSVQTISPGAFMNAFDASQESTVTFEGANTSVWGTSFNPNGDTLGIPPVQAAVVEQGTFTRTPIALGGNNEWIREP
ncbi:MAG: leucine-rich repeat domain-containing protein [Spirochaetes bacterium]|nr:leucine-rich repeat domain-containing protein [Spirochaetota bacterium]